jgi:hypothetical protein
VRAADVQWRADTIKAPHDVFAIDATDGGDSCLDDLGTAMLTRNPSAPAGPFPASAPARWAWATPC